jgi:hypothetical protein
VREWLRGSPLRRGRFEGNLLWRRLPIKNSHASKRQALGNSGPRRHIHPKDLQPFPHRFELQLLSHRAQQYSLAETEQLVIKGIGAEGKLKEEQVMTLNHKEAIRYLAQNAQELTPDEAPIRTSHYLLADCFVAPELTDQIRNDGFLVSGTTYLPLEGRERLPGVDKAELKARIDANLKNTI